jgi:hypothetical protein
MLKIISSAVAGSESDDCWGSGVMSCCSYKLVAEAMDSSGTQRKGNVHHWSLYQATASEDMIVATSVHV